MRSRNRPRRPWGSEALPERNSLWVVFGFVAGIVLLVTLPFSARDMFVRDIYGPLLHGDPFVRVNYSHFAVPALVFGGALVAILGTLLQVRRWLGAAIDPSPSFVRWCVKGMYLSVVLMFVLPAIGGPLTERYVKAEGYVYCGKLFELGVATYSRGYVNDPRVCVSPTALAATLERHGYSDAARRYRFEKE